MSLSQNSQMDGTFSDSGPVPAHDPGAIAKCLVIVIVCCICLVYLMRYEIINGFTVLPGDRYDGVISAAILEHWSNVFSGRQNWSDVQYFFPYARTIAQTDGFFLVGVAYTPFRWLGFDPFISQELANALVKASGFVGMHLFCRKLSARFRWALLAALLFTLSNSMTSHGSRYQLATVAFAPIMALLMWNAINALLYEDARWFRIWSAAAGLFYGAWCMTCFYMAWSFCFFSTAFTVAMLGIIGRRGTALLRSKIVSQLGSVLFAVCAALFALIPFAYAYVPKALEVGVRQWEAVSVNTVPIAGILQVGRGNVVFGTLYNDIVEYLPRILRDYHGSPEHYNMGFAIPLFFFFICGSIFIFRRWTQLPSGVILKSGTIATLVTWLFLLNVGGFSAWWFVYKLFPGARALNVVSVYQVMLALPVVAIAIRYISLQRLRAPIGIFIASILIVSEFNRPYLALNRSTELARMTIVNSPPSDCHVFYVSGWSGQETIPDSTDWLNNTYPHNVTAMIIAQQVGIPTINGQASFNPPDWNFGYPHKSDYDQRVRAYAEKHHLTGLCQLDLNTKNWALADFSPTH